MQKNKVLITGSGGLSKALAIEYIDHYVYCTSRKNGYNLNDVSEWGEQFLDYDILFNCAYNDNDQVKILGFFSEKWKNIRKKSIISIGSIVSDYPRTEIEKERDFFEYRYNKQSLQKAFSDIARSCLCDIRLINLGPMNTAMTDHLDISKLDVNECAKIIKNFVEVDKRIKRIDIWE